MKLFAALYLAYLIGAYEAEHKVRGTLGGILCRSSLLELAKMVSTGLSLFCYKDSFPGQAGEWVRGL